MRGLASGGILAMTAMGLGCAEGRAGSDAPPGILLVIADTLRADHVSCYGYERPTTPNLDRLAAEGERYERAYAQSSWTLPGMATLLTGLPPHRHGAGRVGDRLLPLRDSAVTLAERLRAAGFRTAAVTNVVWLEPGSGLDRGFDHYDHHSSSASNRDARDAARTTDAALAWLAKHRDDPFFLVVHYFDAHLTYDPPPPYDSLFEPDDARPIASGFGSAGQVLDLRAGRIALDARARASLVARYDGEIRFLDDQFGRLLRELERIDRQHSTLVMFVADHGEEFWDHGGFEHGHSHHWEVLRVPLVVRRPNGPRGVVRRGRVRQLDVAPTLLEFAGLAPDPALPGRALGTGSADQSVAEGSLWAGDLVSVRTDRGTLIAPGDGSGGRVYGPDDPLELHPREPEPDSELVRLVRSLPARPAATHGEWEPSAEQRARLRALGYVE